MIRIPSPVARGALPLITLAALLAGGCGAATAPAATATPLVVVATAAPTTAPTTPANVPAATATTAPATGESIKPAGGGSAPTAPASPTAAPPTAPAATLIPATTPAPAGSDRLKPVEATPAPAAQATPAGQPKNRYLIEALTKVQPTPTPAPVRKGVANPNVDPQQYAAEVITDLVALAESMERIQELMAAIEDGSAAEADIVAGVQAETDVLNGVYQRQVARDFPPALKRIDDLFAESTRYAAFMMNAFVSLLTTGDERYVAEIESHAAKFETFFGQLMQELS